jgi:hypothetical protein
MDMQTAAFILGMYLIAMLFGTFLFNKNKKEQRQETPANSYDELMAIVTSIMEREIKFKHDMDYKVKDVKVIYDFEEDLKEITKKIIAGISPELFKDLEYYHPRQYLITVITRNVQIFLIEYTRQNKISSK